MGKVWILADQHPEVTGVFLRALVEVLASLPSSQVEYHYEDLGRMAGYPDKFAERFARRVTLSSGDRVVIFMDTESEGLERSLRRGQDLRMAVSEACVAPLERVLFMAVVPMTEALYLLDQPMLEVVQSHMRPRRGVRGPRRARPTLPDLHAQRVAAALGTSLAPTADQIKSGLPNAKRRLAADMAERIRRPDYIRPSVRCFDILEAFLLGT